MRLLFVSLSFRLQIAWLLLSALKQRLPHLSPNGSFAFLVALGRDPFRPDEKSSLASLTWR